MNKYTAYACKKMSANKVHLYSARYFLHKSTEAPCEALFTKWLYTVRLMTQTVDLLNTCSLNWLGRSLSYAEIVLIDRH